MSLLNPWLSLSLMVLLAWLIVFIFKKNLRKEMLWASIITAPIGLTELIFAPKYWLPDSLFNLTLKIGFDIEGLIFSFAIGGIGSVIYGAFFKIKYEKMSRHEMHNKRHKFHLLALVSPAVVFFPLYFLTSLNPIYTASITMFIGAISALYCRPDLKKNMFFSGLMFLVLYFVIFSLFMLFYPGIVFEYWNLSAISGILILGIPIEELMFAFTFGMLWSSYYEHIKWYKLKGKS